MYLKYTFKWVNNSDNTYIDFKAKAIDNKSIRQEYGSSLHRIMSYCDKLTDSCINIFKEIYCSINVLSLMCTRLSDLLSMHRIDGHYFSLDY